MTLHPITAVGSALLSALALVGPNPGADAAGAHGEVTGHTRVIGDCVHRTIEPRKVVSACADSGEYAVIARYGSWHRRQAWGSGHLVINDCSPDCAEGAFHHYPATFRFHRVVDTEAGPIFSRLGVTYVRGGREHDTELFLPTRPL